VAEQLGGAEVAQALSCAVRVGHGAAAVLPDICTTSAVASGPLA
jgi:hypothetical protein